MLKIRYVVSHARFLRETAKVHCFLRSAQRTGTAAVLAAWLVGSGTASAEVITFQDQPLGLYPGGSVTVAAGPTSVVFTGPDLQIRDISGLFPPEASRVITTAGDAGVITASFAPGFTASFVQITNWIHGRFTDEIDTIVMSAFDPSNTLLGTVTSSKALIGLSFPRIARVTFDDQNDGRGFVLDNFTFSATPVPEPGSLLLFGTGAGALLARLRVRKPRA
jgi:hypothetical protein